METQVQILYDAVYGSFRANALGKGMNPLYFWFSWLGM